jgi:hypothetical protein
VANVAYPISRSLRFRNDASAYLNRTPSVASSRTTFTYSAWVKISSLQFQYASTIFSAINSAGTGSCYIRVNGNAGVDFGQYNTASDFEVNTAAACVDVSAWYHFVVAIDDTQATAANRVKIYINGVQQTLSGTYPTQNQVLLVNDTQPHNIGRLTSGIGQFFSGYLTEVNFINGQALTPSSFGGTNAVTGVWEPRQYTGTYGTNGFYLNFKDNTSTSTLGLDYSGNNNNWTTNNISLTAGSTYDSMIDVPTQWVAYGTSTSEVRGNYAVMNPLNRAYSTFTLSDGNLGWTSSTVNMGAFSTIQLPTSGKYYWEIVMTANAGGNPFLGLGPATDSLGNIGLFYRTGGTKEQYGGASGNGSFSYGATWTTNDVIGVAYDADTSGGQVTFYKNNVSQGVAFSSLLTNFPMGLFAAFQNNANGTTTFNINFGQRPFAYTPPAGFRSLCTTNLPSPTILQGIEYMGATTYSGDSTSNRVITTGGGSQFVWIKRRNSSTNNILFDVLRGAGDTLYSNLTNAAAANGSFYVQQFGTTGFTLGTGGDAADNITGGTYVAWSWNAGTTTVTNTAGSISAQVRANPTAGFSIVTYTGTGSAATVGHGLGVAPSMIFVKTRNITQNWIVYNSVLGKNQLLYLNSTDSAITNSDYWGTGGVTSTVFGLKGGGFSHNLASEPYVAYCFAPVAGYSAMGSYTGNASTDGPFVFTGFRPRYVLIKRTDSTEDWIVMDSARNTFNVANSSLFPNGAFSETTDSNRQEDFLSNGFKIRSSGVWLNASGGTFVYMAFAENPFKNALAR